MRTILLLALAMIWVGFSDAQTKRAFIVGVQNYDELTDLSKTLADAEGYADVFEDELGFTVTKLLDPSFTDFLIALSDFEASIEEGDEVVFVFSGHGWSDGARNFVAMRDAPLGSTEVVLERLTFDLNEAVINKFRAKNPSLVLAIVDACRDNPFDLGTKTITKGLVPQQTIPGTLVVYAAGASQREAFLAAYHAFHTTGEDRYGYPKEMFPADAIKIIQESDLDGDGYLDYYVTIEHIFFCGSGGCLHEVVLHEDGNYRAVYQSNGGNLQILDTEQEGVRDLARGFGFTYERMSVYELMRYDGTDYQIGAVMVCSYLTTYCGLSNVFAEDEEDDSDQRMVFFPVDDREAMTQKISAGTIYSGLESAFARDQEEIAGASFDEITGVDSTGTFVLVDIWKGTHGVARLDASETP